MAYRRVNLTIHDLFEEEPHVLLVIRNDAAATTVCGPAVAFSSRVTSHVHIIPERHRRDVCVGWGGDGVRVPLAPNDD